MLQNVMPDYPADYLITNIPRPSFFDMQTFGQLPNNGFN
jgi:hypothetical protein